jgi:hypothetical protein
LRVHVGARAGVGGPAGAARLALSGGRVPVWRLWRLARPSVELGTTFGGGRRRRPPEGFSGCRGGMRFRWATFPE